MNIRRQQQISAGVFGIAVLLVYITMFLSARQMDRAIERSGFAGNINAAGVSGLRTVTVDYILAPHQRPLLQWWQRHATLKALLANDLYEGTGEQVIIERLRARHEYLGEIFPKLTRLFEERGREKANTSIRVEVEARLVTQIMVATQDMVTDAAQLMRSSHARLIQVQQHESIIVAVAVAFMGILIVVNFVLAVRAILDPIRELQRGAEIIGAGDLAYRTNTALNNEIGALSRAFDAMASRLAQSQAKLEQNAAQLAAANRELESFSYSVSHDLRAPLRGIDGWSLALLEDCGEQLDEKGREYLGLVRSETQRMGQLIDDLLQLSRVTRGELRREPVDLSAIGQAIADRLRDANPDRAMEFAIQPGLVANADPRLLEIALTNLLGNACKFTEPRPLARIEFGTIEPSPSVGTPRKVFFVRDNGVGFDMAHVDKLFSAFQRLHKASEFPGTGIGLATVQRVVRRHGGRVWAEAQADRGASFYFTLQEG